MAKRLDTLWILRAACALLASCGLAMLGSCGHTARSRAGMPAPLELRVVDGAGAELPASSARLVALAGEGTGAMAARSYAVYVLDGAAAGFSLSYPADTHLVRVERGDYFAAGDLYLAAASRTGRVEVGGYRFGARTLPDGGALVARIVLATGAVRKALAALPTDAGCVPTGFGYTDNGDGSATFHWSFHSTGDYNQDGEVNISDLTPVGASFHLKNTDAGWTGASLADGDGNGEVNISDITPIGVNYATQVSGYKLEQGAAQSGPFTELASLLLTDGTASPWLAFSYLDPAAVDGGWYRVRAFASIDPASGAATDPLQVSLVPAGDAPVADFTYAPPAPLTGELVSFTDASTGSPTSWNWTYGDGGTGQGPFQSHSYAAAGTYTVTLLATNVHGSRQASQQVTVSDPPPVYGPEDTFVAQSSATLSAPGTAFNINSTDLPDNTDILFGPLMQGMQPVDNHLVMTYPYRGGLDEPATPHPDIHAVLGIVAMTVSGLVIYGPSNASTITVNGATWTYDANAAKINGEDIYGGHASPQNGGQYHYHDVAFITNNSWVGVEGFVGVYAWADGHSKLVGWAEDGYPIYGPYGYVDPLDSGSGVTRMTSGWSASNTGANRPPAVTATTASASTSSMYIVFGSDPGALGMNPGMRVTAINGVVPPSTIYLTNQQNVTYVGGGHPPYMGPANGVEVNTMVDVPSGASVKCEFLAGCFIEDEAYAGGGTLDRYNGRWCVTPDYPGGTYAYFCTMDAAGIGMYPYMVGPELYGSMSVGSTPGTGYVRPTQ